MDTQQFKLHADHCSFDKAYVPELENLSTKEKDSIIAIMKEYLLNCEMDMSRRYVAMGNWGDCVIYENDSIMQVADSG